MNAGCEINLNFMRSTELLRANALLFSTYPIIFVRDDEFDCKVASADSIFENFL